MEEKSLKVADLWSGLALAALGVFIVVEARQWDFMGADGPGPGFFPLWYGVVMVALSLLLVVNSVRRGAWAEPAKPVNWRETGRALGVWAAFAACIALLKVLGFLLGFALLVLFVVFVVYRRPLFTALAVAAGSALGFYLVFPLALNVSLPVGVFGF